MIVTVTLNPCVDHALFTEGLHIHDANRVIRIERDAGGKGINASRVIHALGGQTIASGLLGGPTGAYVRHVMDEEGVPHDFVRVSGETRTNFCIEDGTGEPPTTINEPGPTIAERELDRLFGHLEVHMPECSWLHVAGSIPQGVSPEAMHRFGALAREFGVHLSVDADGKVLKAGVEAGPAFVKPNEVEAERLLGRTITGRTEAVAAALDIRRLILAQNPIHDPIVLLSLGADGAVMVCASGIWSGESPHIRCTSTVGSGDSMVAATLLALASGLPPEIALQRGLAAGAATASLEGAGMATRETVDQLFEQARVTRLSNL